VANSEEKLHAVLASLEECQRTLALNGERDAAQLVSVAILALRIKLHRIEDSELRALCDAMVREVEAAERQRAARPPEGPRARPPVALRLVK